jgi:hypothetical protein
LEVERDGRVNTLLHFLLPTLFSPVWKRKILKTYNESGKFYRSEQVWLSSKINIWEQVPRKTFKKNKNGCAKLNFKT